MDSKISKKSILVLIFMMIGVIIVGTFAWLSYRTQDTAMVLTVGDIDSAVITLTPYQINSKMGSVTAYTSGIVTNVDAVNNSPVSKKFRLYYQVDSIDSNLAISAFKYTITRSSTKNGTYTKYGNDGNFNGVVSGDNVTVLEETLTGGQTYYYKVYLWLDGSGNVSSAQGKTFSGELRAEIITLPSEYQQVEYLESNGTQYILTDVLPSSHFKLEADVYVATSSDSQPTFAGAGDTSSIQCYYAGGKPKVWTQGGGTGSNTAYYDQKIHYIAEASPSGLKVNINGSKFTSSNAYNGGTSKNLMLFAYNSSGSPAYPFKGRIYNLKIYDNNVMIRNFVPCYKINGNIITPGMYDTVTARFYEKGSNSADFTYGPAV